MEQKQLTGYQLDGLIAKVGLPAWGLYNVLLARDGNLVFAELEAMLGVTSKTLRKYFDVLKAANLVDTVEKKVIFTDELFFTSPNMLYSVSPSLKDIKEAEVKKSGHDVFTFWREKYEIRYGVSYLPANWGRDQRNAKILAARYENRIFAIIEVVMRLYETRWYNQSHPRPTIGAMVSWLAAQADGYVTTDSPVVAAEPVEISLDDFDAKFGLGGATNGT